MASPHVAGAAALYMATHPNATPAQVRSALLANVEPGPIAGDADGFPEGVLNVGSNFGASATGGSNAQASANSSRNQDETKVKKEERRKRR
jgi:subtilisin family serine protease